MADNILLPELYRKKHERRKKPIYRGSGFMKIIIMLFTVLAVSGALFSFADIGGNIALGIAKNYLGKNYGIGLNADKITGNPIKGYTIHNFGLSNLKLSQDIFSAEFLSIRLNLAAAVTGNLRLSEISSGGISMDVEQFISAVKSIDISAPGSSAQASSFMAAPAFAEDDSALPDIPVDSVTVRDSRFSSSFGIFDVREIRADIAHLDIYADGSINGLPLKGNVNMDSLVSVNKSDISLGSGHITATGGLNPGNLDIHMSAEDCELGEITALYPAMLKADDFDGKADFTADITGTADNPRISGSVNYSGTKIYGYPVERASANIAYSSNRISVSNIQASAFNVPLQGEIAAAVRPGEKLSVMVKLDGSEASLEGLDKILGVPELKALGGKVSLFSVNVSGHTDSLSGLANFSAPRISYGGRTLTDIRAQMKLPGSGTASVDGKFMFEGAQGYISGNVASVLTNPNMNITAKIAGLDIKRVESMIPDGPQYKLGGKITASVTVKGTASNPSVTGEINSPEFSGFGQKITKPAINFAYSGKTLTLSRTEGTLNGMPVNVSGKISGIPSEKPTLDLSATITMTPSALKEYVPDIDSLKLKGSINAGLKVQGSADNPSVSFLASSQNLQAMDMITAKGLELTTAMNGDLSKLEKISADVSAKSITAFGADFTEAKANISRNGDTITLGGFRANIGRGTVSGSGSASVSGKYPHGFSFSFKNIELASLAASSGIDVKGDISGTLNIAGNGKDITGKGSLNIPALSAFGLKLSDVELPLSYSGNNFVSKGGTAKLYGGTLSNSLTFSAGTMKFTDDVSASGVDMNGLIQDISGGLEGKITGTGRLSFKLSGTAKGNAEYSGSGNFSMGEGAVTGFRWLDLLTKLHKSDGLRFASVSAPLSLQTGKLIIKAGASANAVKDDALYKYAKLSRDGTIDFAGDAMMMDFYTEASVNCQLINAVQGGAKGGIESLLKGGASGFEDSLKAFLAGGLSGAQKNASTGDFRTVSLRIHGRADSLAFSGLKIGEPALKAGEKNDDKSQPAKTPAQAIQKKAESVKEQVKQQVTEKASELLPDKLKETLNLKASPQTQTVKPKNSTQTQAPAQTTRQKAEDRLKEELQKGIQKGLEDLFRK